MSAILSAGPRLANVAKIENSKYYPIDGLLDELGMMDKQERDKFPAFLSEYLRWDPKSGDGYQAEELAKLPESHMAGHARCFLDSATIDITTHASDDIKAIAGLFYFPRRKKDVGPKYSPHVKEWSYLSHRKLIIELVAAIMITQIHCVPRRQLRKRLGKEEVNHTRTKRRCRQQPAMREQGATISSCVVDASDASSDVFSDVDNNSIASPQHRNVQDNQSGHISRQSTASSRHNSLVRRAGSAGESISYQRSASPATMMSNFSTRAESPTSDVPVNSGIPGRESSSSFGSTSIRHTASPPASKPATPSPSHETSPILTALYPPVSAKEAQKTRLIAKIEALSSARTVCMEKHCEQQIAARSADGAKKLHFMAKADGVLDMLVDLDRTLQEDRTELGKFAEP